MTRLVCTYPGPYDAATLASIQDRFGVSALLAKALIRRGLTREDAIRTFLHPETQPLSDPFLLPDMRAAVTRIQTALQTGERICIYGDYDADGVCASAILLRFLKTKTNCVRAYIPSRHDEGYGMHAGAVQALKDDGVRLIITVDNGISALEEIELCSRLGIDVIVTDHHRPGDCLPKCCAVVSAMRADAVYPDRNLCGAGVALQLVRALDPDSETQDALPLAAVATIADVVPLLGENRHIAATGLPLVSQQKGLSALMRAAGLAEARLSSTSAAYAIAPRLNAAGRMGDAGLALKLLLSDDDAECVALAARLNEANQIRRGVETQVFCEAEAIMQEKALARRGAIFVYGAGWNKGVLGIVASRITERYHRPSIVFALEDGVLHGSGRSVEGVDLFRMLSLFRDRFLRFGGHAGAAGVTMLCTEFERFSEDFCREIEKAYPEEMFEPHYPYEQRVELSALDRASVAELARLAPFGEGNKEPVYLIENAVLRFGKTIGKGGAHFSAEVNQQGASMRMVAFGFGEAARRLTDGVTQDVLASVSVHSYLGRESVELLASHICAHDLHILKFYDAIRNGILYNIERVFAQDALLPYLDAMADAVSQCDFALDTMRGRYQALRRIVPEGGVSVRAVANMLPLAELLSLLVFWELGFFVLTDGGQTVCAVRDCRTKPLTESRIYGSLISKVMR